MKRIIITFFVLAAFVVILSAQSSKQILQEAIREGVEAKVTLLQEEIGFTDAQAEHIKEIELEFLRDIQNVKKCFLSSHKRKVEKLVQRRDDKLDNILTRGQYIRYLGGSIDDIKKHPIRVD